MPQFPSDLNIPLMAIHITRNERENIGMKNVLQMYVK